MGPGRPGLAGWERVPRWGVGARVRGCTGARERGLWAAPERQGAAAAARGARGTPALALRLSGCHPRAVCCGPEEPGGRVRPSSVSWGGGRPREAEALRAVLSELLVGAGGPGWPCLEPPGVPLGVGLSAAPVSLPCPRPLVLDAPGPLHPSFGGDCKSARDQWPCSSSPAVGGPSVGPLAGRCWQLWLL